MPFFSSAEKLNFDELRFITVDESPANFVNAQGELVGYSVDIIKRLQTRLDITKNIEVMPEARAMHTVKNKPDVVMFSITRTPERESRFHWLAHVLTKRWILYSKYDANFDNSSLDTLLDNLTVGVIRGDIREQWMKANYPGRSVGLLNYYNGVEMLLKGRIDLLFYESYGMFGTLEKLGYQRGEVKSQYVATSSDVYIVMSKFSGSDLMAKALKQELSVMQASVWYQKHTELWLNELNKSGSGDAWIYKKVLQY
ncbi:MAG: transporter substrate-binding domain-containing protein [Gammaproteobacteria bacterium]|nr:transporter substrate-binding domain-containing protein [Gammaproteobacteria bacterium]